MDNYFKFWTIVLIFSLFFLTACNDQEKDRVEANIIAPSSNSSYTYGDIVSFIGVATDAEEGEIAGSMFTWRSSLDGLIETGSKEFSTEFLSVGSHRITLKVRNSDGATDSSSINVTIRSEDNGNDNGSDNDDDNGNGGDNGDFDGDRTNSIGMTFNYIEPGTFTMGSPEDEPGRGSDETQHEVTLTEGFYMQTTAVTQGQWEAVMGDNPSYHKDCGDDCPVESVSWDDIQDYIMALNQLEGTDRYALPTEAQWEYAARAGSTTAFANGEITATGNAYDPVLDSMGWYYYNSDSSIHPVAQKDPNDWGLYDMHGNVWEWVADWYDTYPTTAVTDPTGPESGTERVIRSGSVGDSTTMCRSANRIIPAKGTSRSFSICGFRLVLAPR